MGGELYVIGRGSMDRVAQVDERRGKIVCESRDLAD